MKRAPTELRFFKPVDDPSDTELALCFLARFALCLVLIVLAVWSACLTWGPQ